MGKVAVRVLFATAATATIAGSSRSSREVVDLHEGESEVAAESRQRAEANSGDGARRRGKDSFLVHRHAKPTAATVGQLARGGVEGKSLGRIGRVALVETERRRLHLTIAFAVNTSAKHSSAVRDAKAVVV